MMNRTSEEIVRLYEESRSSNEAGDAIWILTSAFIIFTMQSGFGLLEAGTVSQKNETNIMVKNAIDVICGGLGYWICGFAFSFGDDPNYTNSFVGIGHFFMDSSSDDFGDVYAKYFFQLSFATTATTIVSGAMAERTNLKAYMMFSFISMFSYVFPAHWMWDANGFLNKLDVVDIAGCGPVHLVGGVCSLVATLTLKPRAGRFSKGEIKQAVMASPSNVVLGTFMLWWGWLGFNCGSTFGISGGKWKLASKAAITTVNASIGSGLWVIFYCYMLTKKFKKKLDIGIFTSSVLGGLVSITAGCAVVRPWEAIIIGIIGGIITCYGAELMCFLKIDDPVCCIPVHCFCGTWGLLAVGIFCEEDRLEDFSKYNGVTKGGPWKFLGYQALSVVCIAAWSAASCFLQLRLVMLFVPLRMTEDEEELGADFVEHGILHDRKDYGRRKGAFGGSRSTRKRKQNISTTSLKQNPKTSSTEAIAVTIDNNQDESTHSTAGNKDKSQHQLNSRTEASYVNEAFTISSLFRQQKTNGEDKSMSNFSSLCRKQKTSWVHY